MGAPVLCWSKDTSWTRCERIRTRTFVPLGRQLQLQLLRVSVTGVWATWLDYFLKGVTKQSMDSLSRTRRLREMQDRYRDLLQTRRESANALRLVDELFAMPYMTAPRASKPLNVSNAGARRILDRLVDAGIFRFLPDE